jgi:hypothetical protein
MIHGYRALSLVIEVPVQAYLSVVREVDFLESYLSRFFNPCVCVAKAFQHTRFLNDLKRVEFTLPANSSCPNSASVVLAWCFR